ncbi:hypothetical protein EVAR_94290_1 [Eumeta japonica]|uniref:Uncharacterized protein n=1 Tax=Eumeta variegata TaxID=151549 RepID=A0A4C1UGB4_EUMVA|nr:hypothetical protein EVAR_94290_1 [Eumeta japonica]
MTMINSSLSSRGQHAGFPAASRRRGSGLHRQSLEPGRVSAKSDLCLLVGTPGTSCASTLSLESNSDYCKMKTRYLLRVRVRELSKKTPSNVLKWVVSRIKMAPPRHISSRHRRRSVTRFTASSALFRDYPPSRGIQVAWKVRRDSPFLSGKGIL